MRAVITGSSGFIGSHLVQALLARGDTVRTVTRPQSAPVSTIASTDARIERHTIDLLDAQAVNDSPVWDDATHVFHLAGVTKARTDAQFHAGNVRPTANILAALAERVNPPRFVLVSSQAAAGPASGIDAPVREHDTPHPIEGYGWSKLATEREGERWMDHVPTVIVRPASVYGPGDRDFLLVFRQAARRIAFYAAPRDQCFSIVHVTDIVDGLIRAAENPSAPGNSYFLADESPTTWRALYAAVAEAAGAKPVEVQLPLAVVRAAAFGADIMSAVTGKNALINRHKAALAGPRWWICDSARARDTLGWKPQVERQRGVQETYLWYLREGWLSRRKA
jgi:nucleoside-diphosphate-sugar epimerase